MITLKDLEDTIAVNKALDERYSDFSNILENFIDDQLITNNGIAIIDKYSFINIMQDHYTKFNTRKFSICKLTFQYVQNYLESIIEDNYNDLEKFFKTFRTKPKLPYYLVSVIKIARKTTWACPVDVRAVNEERKIEKRNILFFCILT